MRTDDVCVFPCCFTLDKCLIDLLNVKLLPLCVDKNKYKKNIYNKIPFFFLKEYKSNKVKTFLLGVAMGTFWVNFLIYFLPASKNSKFQSHFKSHYAKHLIIYLLRNEMIFFCFCFSHKTPQISLWYIQNFYLQKIHTK